MKEILRLYIEVKGQETCIKEPKEILKLLSKPKLDIDLDFDHGGRVKMGSSRDFIGQTVKVGDHELEIQVH
jgi:hypothetical protein